MSLYCKLGLGSAPEEGTKVSRCIAWFAVRVLRIYDIVLLRSRFPGHMPEVGAWLTDGAVLSPHYSF